MDALLLPHLGDGPPVHQRPRRLYSGRAARWHSVRRPLPGRARPAQVRSRFRAGNALWGAPAGGVVTARSIVGTYSPSPSNLGSRFSANASRPSLKSGAVKLAAISRFAAETASARSVNCARETSSFVTRMHRGETWSAR